MSPLTFYVILLFLFGFFLWWLKHAIGPCHNDYDIILNTSIDIAWSYITDPEKMKKWVIGLVEVTFPQPRTIGEDPKVGDKSKNVMVIGNERTEMECTITFVAPKRRIKAELEACAFLEKVDYQLISKDYGMGIDKKIATEFRYRAASTYKGLFARLFSPLITIMAQKHLVQCFKKLKELSEEEYRSR